MALSDKREPVLILSLLLAAWAMAFGWSLIGAYVAAPTGDGFSNGLNRVTHFLGWQAVAGLFGLAAFGVGRAWPRGSGLRQVSVWPFRLALLLLAALLAFYGWAMVQR